MANVLEYILSLKKGDFVSGMKEAEERTKSLDEGFDKIKESLIQIAGIAAGVEFFKGAAEKFVEMEKVSAQLRVTVSMRGGLASDLKELTEQSEALGKSSFFNHVEIERSQKALLNYGLSINDTKKSIGVLADVGLVTGEDLGQVSSSIGGAAATGRARALKEYGLGFLKLETDMSRAGAEARNYERIVNALSQRFAGASEEMKNTEFFQIKKIKDELEDFEEKVGKDLLKLFDKLKPSIFGVIDRLKEFLTWIEHNKTEVKSFAEGIAITVGGVYAFRTAFLALTAVMEINPFILLGTALAAIVVSMRELINKNSELVAQREKNSWAKATNDLKGYGAELDKHIEKIKKTVTVHPEIDIRQYYESEKAKAKEVSFRNKASNLDLYRQADEIRKENLGALDPNKYLPYSSFETDLIKRADEARQKEKEDALKIAIIERRQNGVVQTNTKPAKPFSIGESSSPAKTESARENITINIGYIKTADTIEIKSETAFDAVDDAKFEQKLANKVLEVFNSVNYLGK